LNRVEDAHGNFMTTTYIKDQGQIYPKQIDYAGNGALQPTSNVKFILESRTDAQIVYTIGFPVLTAYRLKTIDIFANGGRVRKYELEYDANLTASGVQYSARTSRSLLGAVRQYGKDGVTQLPPRTFSPNTTAWILGLPTKETIYQGIGTTNRVAATDYFYDGATSCQQSSTNQTPTQGNVTRIVRWLADGTSPEVRRARTQRDWAALAGQRSLRLNQVHLRHPGARHQDAKDRLARDPPWSFDELPYAVHV
jgi:hypothetical protein